MNAFVRASLSFADRLTSSRSARRTAGAIRRPAGVAVAASCALLTASACVPPENQAMVVIRGAQPIQAPECTVNPNGQLFLASGVLDIGANATNANSYINAFTLDSNLPFATYPLERGSLPVNPAPNYGTADTNLVFLESAEVFFETDVAQGLENPATPGGGAAPRKSAVGGTIDANGTAVVFVNTVTEDDARALQQEPLVQQAGLSVQDPDRTVRIIANVAIEGRTAGGTFVKTPFFAFPLDLCVGCLTQQPQCPPGTELTPQEVCNFGQDAPVAVCQQ